VAEKMTSERVLLRRDLYATLILSCGMLVIASFGGRPTDLTEVIRPESAKTRFLLAGVVSLAGLCVSCGQRDLGGLRCSSRHGKWTPSGNKGDRGPMNRKDRPDPIRRFER
jgi:hypothetical protein